MTNTSQLTITQLASTINAHTGKAEHYADKAEQHYKAAGLHLIEAKKRIAAGEYEGGFVKFLKDECKALSSSRAYELIAIANGTRALSVMRKATAARVQQSRDALRYVAESSQSQPVPDAAIDPKIRAGMDAWKRIGETKADRAAGWHDIGMALLEGWKIHPKGKDFNAWCTQEGFNDISWETQRSLMFSSENADELDRLRHELDMPESAGNAFIDIVNEIAAKQPAEDAAIPPATPAEALILQIVAACRGKTEAQLKTILRKAGGTA